MLFLPVGSVSATHFLVPLGTWSRHRGGGHHYTLSQMRGRDGLRYCRKEGGRGCNTNQSFALIDASGVSRQSVAAVLFLHRWIPKAEARMP